MSKPYYSILNDIRDEVTTRLEKKVREDRGVKRPEYYYDEVLNECLKDYEGKKGLAYKLRDYEEEIKKLLGLDIDFDYVYRRGLYKVS